MNKTIISVDIGKKGAIVVRAADGQDKFFAMPMIKNEVDYGAIYSLFHLYSKHIEKGQILIIYEKLGVIFGTSKKTAFSMGYQSGAIEMACIGLGVPYYMVGAKAWQKEMFQGTNLVTKKSKSGKSTVTDTKATALIVCKQLFPNQKLTFGDKATKPHDGLVDAILIAEFAKRKNL